MRGSRLRYDRERSPWPVAGGQWPVAALCRIRAKVRRDGLWADRFRNVILEGSMALWNCLTCVQQEARPALPFLANRFRLLATAIPARSFAMGANPCPQMDSVEMPGLRDDWPAIRENWRWFHSDIEHVAYLYVPPVYKAFVERGGLR